MQRKTVGYAVTASLMLALGVPTSPRAATRADRSHHPSHAARVTACGVERWWVKTGIDPDARFINQKAVVPTTIVHLRSLPAPAYLPSRSRLRPVETTVWAVDAILLRYKVEQDSDVHLVIADTGGRTMIAEIPDPSCVGPQSPLLTAIRKARWAFVAHFHPTDYWQRPRIRVQLAGVGFFDFKHGQSGVAPNAIELHPVLAMRWAGTAPLPPLPASTPAPTTGAGTGFSIGAYVSPNPVAYGAYPTLYARTTMGAACTASVVYSTGYSPTSFNGSARTVGSNGLAQWSWHMESKGTGGTATVTCSYHGQTRSAATSFSIA